MCTVDYLECTVNYDLVGEDCGIKEWLLYHNIMIPSLTEELQPFPIDAVEELFSELKNLQHLIFIIKVTLMKIPIFNEFLINTIFYRNKLNHQLRTNVSKN